MIKELAPISLPPEDFWKSIFLSLAGNKDNIQPVTMQDPETKEDLGKFYASIEKEEQRVYLRIENITGEFGDLIIKQGLDDGWQIIIGGAYRIPITNLFFKSG